MATARNATRPAVPPAPPNGGTAKAVGGGASGPSTDDLLSQLASEEIDRLMAEESLDELGGELAGVSEAPGQVASVGPAGGMTAVVGEKVEGKVAPQASTPPRPQDPIAALAADAIDREVTQQVANAVPVATVPPAPVTPPLAHPATPPKQAQVVAPAKVVAVSLPPARENPVAAPAAPADAPATQADIDAMFATASDTPAVAEPAPPSQPTPDATPTADAPPANSPTADAPPPPDATPDATLAVARELDALFHAPVTEEPNASAATAPHPETPTVAEPSATELDALFAELTKDDPTQPATKVADRSIQPSAPETTPRAQPPAPPAPTHPQVPTPETLSAATPPAPTSTDPVEGELDALFDELTKGEQTTPTAPVPAVVAPTPPTAHTDTPPPPPPAKPVAPAASIPPTKPAEHVDEALEAELNELYAALTSADPSIQAEVAPAPPPTARKVPTTPPAKVPRESQAVAPDPALQASLDQLVSELAESDVDIAAPAPARSSPAPTPPPAADHATDAATEETLDELFNELTSSDPSPAKAPGSNADTRNLSPLPKAREPAKEERAPVRPDPVVTNEAGFSVIRDGAWRKKEGADNALQERVPSAEELERLAKLDIAPVRPGEEDVVERKAEVAPRRDIDTTDAPVVDDNAPSRPENELPPEEKSPLNEPNEDKTDAKPDDFGLPGFDNVTFDDPSAVPPAPSDTPLVTAPGQVLAGAPTKPADSSGPPFINASEDWHPAEKEISVLDSLSDPGTSRSKWVMKLLEVMNSPFEAVDSKLRDLLGKIAIVTIFHGAAVLLYVYLIRGG